MKIIALTEDNYHIYRDSLLILFGHHGYSEESTINFNEENYCYICDSGIIISYALIKKSKVIYDKKHKYINKKCYIIKDERKFANDFILVEMECLYNLIRLPDERYKGAGIALVDGLISLKKKICLATIIPKIYSYYIKSGFQPTDYFDLDVNNVWQKILEKSHN